MSEWKWPRAWGDPLSAAVKGDRRPETRSWRRTRLCPFGKPEGRDDFGGRLQNSRSHRRLILGRGLAPEKLLALRELSPQLIPQDLPWRVPCLLAPGSTRGGVMRFIRPTEV